MHDRETLIYLSIILVFHRKLLYRLPEEVSDSNTRGAIPVFINRKTITIEAHRRPISEPIFPTTADTKAPEIRRLRPRRRHQQRFTQHASRIPRALQREERTLREALRKVLDRSEIHGVYHDLPPKKWGYDGI